MTEHSPRYAWLRYLHLGMQFGGTVCLAAGLGWLLDRTWGLTPWGCLGGALVGVALAIYHLLRSLL